jgi:hypothetical protein
MEAACCIDRYLCLDAGEFKPLKALEIAESNAQAYLRYWRGLLSVSAPAEFQEFNYGFLGDQSAAFLRQSFELGHLALRLAVDVPQSFAGLKSSSFSA